MRTWAPQGLVKSIDNAAQARGAAELVRLTGGELADVTEER
jgi:hypothetical protein